MTDIVDDMHRWRRSIEKLRDEHTRDSEQRREDLERLRAASREALDEAHHLRRQASREGAERRRKTLDRLRGRVADVFGDVAEDLESFREEFRDESERSRRRRRAAVEQSSSAVEQLLEGLRAELSANGTQIAEEAREDREDRNRLFEELRASVRAVRQEARDDCEAFAKRMRQLQDVLNNPEASIEVETNSEVPSPNDRTRGVADEPTEPTEPGERTESAANESGGDETSSVEATAHKRADGGATARSAATPASNRESESSSAELTEIVGIGPSTSDVLKRSDYTTVRELADATPEELRDALDDLAPFSNVEHWIEQARDLVGPRS